MLQARLNTSTTGPSPNASCLQVSTNLSSSTGSLYCRPFTHYVSLACQAHLYAQNHTWIIDSGATHHITHFLSLLTNIQPLNSDLFLPNGHKTNITHIGDIIYANNFQLRQALFVANFHCNLLSVARFNSDNNCYLQFSTTKCLMKVHDSKKMKEIGDLEGACIRLLFYNI